MRKALAVAVSTCLVLQTAPGLHVSALGLGAANVAPSTCPHLCAARAAGVRPVSRRERLQRCSQQQRRLRSSPSMMGDFEEEERVRKMREMLTKQMGGGRGVSPKGSDEWAEPVNALGRGVVLVADPAPFRPGTADRAFLTKFGLNEPVPDALPADRRADVLPVVLLLEHGPSGSVGLVLNRRTGMLMGDLNSDEMRAFCIQPLWQGGVSGTLEMAFLHTYADDIADSTKLTEDGLCLGGDFLAASRYVTEGVGSGFNFRFLVRHTRWRSGELEKEVAMRRWHPFKVGKMTVVRPRDRAGPDAARPMWTDILRMAGGDYQKIQENYYGEKS